MATLINDEQNINFTIDFLKRIKDTIIINDESETFIPFILKLVTPEKMQGKAQGKFYLAKR